ncbi:hypothetical protein BD779DRAFT_1470399 [Infundibulicybe gibba]|nr:hypothetical protein BD779DRAFT_1470399 [Infundibulicybe gibba]
MPASDTVTSNPNLIPPIQRSVPPIPSSAIPIASLAHIITAQKLPCSVWATLILNHLIQRINASHRGQSCNTRERSSERWQQHHSESHQNPGTRAYASRLHDHWRYCLHARYHPPPFPRESKVERLTPATLAVLFASFDAFNGAARQNKYCTRPFAGAVFAAMGIRAQPQRHRRAPSPAIPTLWLIRFVRHPASRAPTLWVQYNH